MFAKPYTKLFVSGVSYLLRGEMGERHIDRFSGGSRFGVGGL